MTISSIWKQTKQTQNALEIAERGGKLYDKFVGFVEDIEKIGSSINKAGEEYDNALKKLSTGSGNLIRQTEILKKLGAKTTKSLPNDLIELSSVDEIDELPESAD
jgi:DNA recombination protein RmuC